MKASDIEFRELDEESYPALKALRQAVRRAIAWHHKLGNPVALGRNGKVYWLFPDGSEVADEDIAAHLDPGPLKD